MGQEPRAAASVSLRRRSVDAAGLGAGGGRLRVFCLVSSGVYIVNDVMDRERDRAHPIKRYRPIASGRLSIGVALAAAGLLEAVGLAAAYLLREPFGHWCAIYAALMAVLLSGVQEHPVPGGPDRGRRHAPASPRGRRSGGGVGLAVSDGLRLPAGAVPGGGKAAMGVSERGNPLLLRAPAGALRLPGGGPGLPLRRHGSRDGGRLRGLQRLVLRRSRATAAARSRRRFPSSSSAWLVTCGSCTGAAAEGTPPRPSSIDDPWLLAIVVGWVATAGWIIYGR